METGYEVEPGPIGRRGDRRRPAVAITVALIAVVVALAKPWDGPVAMSPAVLATPGPPAVAVAIPAPRVLDVRPAAAVPDAVPTWPSKSTPSLLATQTAKEAELALGRLATHAGTWGIGTAGVGPRMLRDEPWSDWTPVAAEIVGRSPVHVGLWPGEDLCEGYPIISDRPIFVAVTTPHDIAPDRVFWGWWTDAMHVTSVAGSVVQISPPGNNGIGYLERLDQAPWPPGRYEFHVDAGDRSVALTVCLTRRG